MICNLVFVLNMLKVAHIVAAFILQWHSAHAECPQMEDLPVMWGDKFTCFAYWYDWGGEYSVTACNGDQYTYADGYDQAPDYGYYIPMGSIFVKPGCTLYMWKGNFYTGSS